MILKEHLVAQRYGDIVDYLLGKHIYHILTYIHVFVVRYFKVFKVV